MRNSLRPKSSIKKIEVVLQLFFKGFLFLVLFQLTSLAEVKAESEEHSGGEENKEHSGGEENNGAFIKKDEYLELNAAVEQLNAKMRAKKDTLMKLLLDKDQVKDPIEFKKIVKQIETEYRDINEIIETIDKKKAMLRFRFPERSFVKNAEKSKVQQIEEIGSEARIEKQMNQLLIRAEQQYQMPLRPHDLRENESRGPASTDEKFDGIKLEQNPEDFSKSLILKK